MKQFEIDVEVRVRKTLRLSMGEAATANDVSNLMAAILEGGDIELATFQKWTQPGGVYPPVPVETVIGNDAPQIVAVREVGEV